LGGAEGKRSPVADALAGSALIATRHSSRGEIQNYHYFNFPFKELRFATIA
jgi:hypothetical protein